MVKLQADLAAANADLKAFREKVRAQNTVMGQRTFLAEINAEMRELGLELSRPFEESFEEELDLDSPRPSSLSANAARHRRQEVTVTNL